VLEAGGGGADRCAILRSLLTNASTDYCNWHTIKIKVKLSVSTEHRAMKAYWGSGGIAARIL